MGVVFEAHAPASAPLRDVTLRNVTIATARTGFVLENVQGLKLENVTIAGKAVEAP